MIRINKALVIVVVVVVLKGRQMNLSLIYFLTVWPSSRQNLWVCLICGRVRV